MGVSVKVTSKRPKMGVIGCGGISRAHFRVAEELQKKGLLELVAVCDIVEAKAREKGEMYKIPYFTDTEKILRMDMDFVDICTGDYTHHVIAKLAAEHGKHMLIEKPMAITLPCCDVIINACRKAGVYYEVAENYFRIPIERAIKEIIDKGIVGKVLQTYAIDPEPAQPSSGLPPFSSHSPIVRLLDMGSHRMSEIRTFAGSEPMRIIGLTKLLSHDPYDDWGHAIVEFESGSIGICEVGYAREGKLDYREIVGTKGTIFLSGRWGGGDMRLTLPGLKRAGLTWEQEAAYAAKVPVQRINHVINGYEVLQSIIVESEPEIIYRNPYADCPIREDRISFADEIMSIANAAAYDKPPEYGIGGRKDIEMCIAMYESSLKGTPVDLPIKSITSFEKKVHEAYEDAFGHRPTVV